MVGDPFTADHRRKPLRYRAPEVAPPSRVQCAEHLAHSPRHGESLELQRASRGLLHLQPLRSPRRSSPRSRNHRPRGLGVGTREAPRMSSARSPAPRRAHRYPGPAMGPDHRKLLPLWRTGSALRSRARFPPRLSSASSRMARTRSSRDRLAHPRGVAGWPAATGRHQVSIAAATEIVLRARPRRAHHLISSVRIRVLERHSAPAPRPRPPAHGDHPAGAS